MREIFEILEFASGSDAPRPITTRQVSARSTLHAWHQPSHGGGDSITSCLEHLKVNGQFTAVLNGNAMLCGIVFRLRLSFLAWPAANNIQVQQDMIYTLFPQLIETGLDDWCRVRDSHAQLAVETMAPASRQERQIQSRQISIANRVRRSLRHIFLFLRRHHVTHLLVHLRLPCRPASPAVSSAAPSKPAGP